MSFLCHELGVHKFRDVHTREVSVPHGTVYIRYQRCQRCRVTVRKLASVRPPRRIRPHRKELEG